VANEISLMSNSDAKDAQTGISLAEELNRLSLEEREAVLHDIHGVSEAIDEVPELVDRSLAEIDAYLEEEHSKGDARGYNLAESISPEYLKQKKLRLMFLRADKFDARKAANKMVQFFDKKLELFGRTKLCKDIELSDMSSSDLECVENGALQLLPSRDRSGRSVLVMALPFLKNTEIENQVG
jgi:hypothetical protein